MSEQNRAMENGIPNTEDQQAISSVSSVHPHPETLTKLVKRLRLMTLTLLPIEVPLESLNDPTSRVITPQVISAYIDAAGDFVEALPYCLLRARKEFIYDANHNPADYEENMGRAIACEVLARRVVHRAPPDRITSMLTTRFKHRENDGDESERLSALEAAIDSHCTIFLSSSEAQDVVNDIWCGRLVQSHDEERGLEFVPFREAGFDGFWSHLSPNRLTVPRYQNIFRIAIWVLFLLVYSQAVREPLDKLDPDYTDLDKWEVVMYVLALSFAFEDVQKVAKLLLFVSWRAIGFWNVVSVCTDALLVAAFSLRIAGILSHGEGNAVLRIRSFQCLSFVAPLIWMKVIPIFDGYKFIGTMQICVARMLQESGIFFCLLALLGVGFLQGLYALDAADGQSDHPSEVMNVLVQALLQAPNYDMFKFSPAGLALYYLWNVATAVILLNVLISLFSSAYEDVVEDASAEYLAYFADKSVGSLRAPDEHLYPAPFNLIEMFFVAPLEYVVRRDTYSKINQYVMSILFFIPLAVIAIYEAELDPSRNKWVKDWFANSDQGIEDRPEIKDPVVEEEAENGMQISKVSFSELISVFPDTTHSSETIIMTEVKELRSEIAELKRLLEEKLK
ncbi:calcium activated cation channel [Panus rudis PR-1116 ss-1]|nr:calcium activated cation channel [Panus rudis PR-1116 ss-1]